MPKNERIKASFYYLQKKRFVVMFTYEVYKNLIRRE